MAFTEAQIDREAKAADSRFFVAPDNRPGQLILDLVANLDSIAAASAAAKEKLQAISESEEKEYQDSLARLAGPGREAAIEIVGRMQTTLEEAYRYNDAVAAIQKAGVSVAAHIRDTMPLGMQMINGNPYWVACDNQGKRQLCGTDDEGEAYIIYGTVADERREVGDEAKLPDYIQLIRDVEAEMSD